MKTFSSKLLYSIDKHCFIMILPTIFIYYTTFLGFRGTRGNRGSRGNRGTELTLSNL